MVNRTLRGNGRNSVDTNLALSESNTELNQIVDSLIERIVELEDRDWEWQRINAEADFEFSREGLADIIKESRLMFLKNPLIQRAVSVQAHYVFGQGVTLASQNEDLNETIQRFLNDPANVSELTSQRAMVDKEEELTVTGNLFLALFNDPQIGRVVVRSIPVEEMRDVICNPEDRAEPWFYKRVWNRSGFDAIGRTAGTAEQITEYYPSWRYNPTGADRVDSIDTHPVRWDVPVYHVKVGGFAHSKFGIPETYAAIDWAKAVKNDLEDYASLRRALARFVWRLTTSGGRRGIDALKTQFNTTVHNGSGEGETNPPPTVGSMFISGDANKLEPIKTSGMAPSPDEGRRLWLMVSAGMGIPETILAGDADVGNLATAKTLDRPTELKMRSRQEHWRSVFEDILMFVIRKSIEAQRGALRNIARVIPDPFTDSVSIDLGSDETANISIDFPNILDHNITEIVGAIISAATLDGKPRADTMTSETVSRLLLVALGVDNVDEELMNLAEEVVSNPTVDAEESFVMAWNKLKARIQEND